MSNTTRVNKFISDLDGLKIYRHTIDIKIEIARTWPKIYDHVINIIILLKKTNDSDTFCVVLRRTKIQLKMVFHLLATNKNNFKMTSWSNQKIIIYNMVSESRDLLVRIKSSMITGNLSLVDADILNSVLSEISIKDNSNVSSLIGTNCNN